MRYALTILILAFLWGCEKKDLKVPEIYEGPLSEMEDIDLDYSENGMVTTKMKAAKIVEFQNGDREFPKGIYMEFFDGTGKLTSTLRANNAFFFKEKNLWRGRGKVEVKNIEKNEQLNTEELFWSPADKNIYTDSFVSIREQDNIISGTGLEAKEDMSDYTIKKISGDIEIGE